MRTHHRGHVAQMLREAAIVALRAAEHPLSTTELRQALPHLPLPGAQGVYPAVQEHVYRQLGWLQKAGVVERVASAQRDAMWTLTPKGAAAEEINALEHALAASAAACTTTAASAELQANREGR